MEFTVSIEERDYILKLREAKQEVILEAGRLLVSIGFSGKADIEALEIAVRFYEVLRTQ